MTWRLQHPSVPVLRWAGEGSPGQLCPWLQLLQSNISGGCLCELIPAIFIRWQRLEALVNIDPVVLCAVQTQDEAKALRQKICSQTGQGRGRIDGPLCPEDMSLKGEATSPRPCGKPAAEARAELGSSEFSSSIFIPNCPNEGVVGGTLGLSSFSQVEKWVLCFIAFFHVQPVAGTLTQGDVFWELWRA